MIYTCRQGILYGQLDISHDCCELVEGHDGLHWNEKVGFFNLNIEQSPGHAPKATVEELWCRKCEGSGTVWDDEDEKKRTCRGLGVIRPRQHSI